MIVYVDTSALLKRVFAELHSDETVAWLRRAAADGATLATSSLAWIETGRALLRAKSMGASVPEEAFDVVLSGIAERALTPDIVSLGRRVGPPTLRDVDAIHLASAILIDAEALVTFDDRLAEAARSVELTVVAPGRGPATA